MKNTWQGYGLAVCVSFLLGGGSSLLYSNSKISAVQADMEEKVEKLEQRLDRDRELFQDMAKGIVRLEEQVKYIRERLE